MLDLLFGLSFGFGLMLGLRLRGLPLELVNRESLVNGLSCRIGVGVLVGLIPELLLGLSFFLLGLLLLLLASRLIALVGLVGLDGLSYVLLGLLLWL